MLLAVLSPHAVLCVTEWIAIRQFHDGWSELVSESRKGAKGEGETGGESADV